MELETEHEDEGNGLDAHLNQVTSDEPEMQVEGETLGEPITDSFTEETSTETEETNTEETTENTGFDKLVDHTFVKALKKNEIIKIGKEAADLHKERCELAVEADRVKKEYKSKIDTLDSQLEYKYQVFRDGGIEVEGECTLKYDHGNEDVIYIFEGKEVDRRDMTQAEREQLSFTSESTEN